LPNFDQLPPRGASWGGKCILAGESVETPPVSASKARSAGRIPFHKFRNFGPSAREFRPVDELASPGYQLYLVVARDHHPCSATTTTQCCTQCTASALLNAMLATVFALLLLLLAPVCYGTLLPQTAASAPVVPLDAAASCQLGSCANLIHQPAA
jgi:hypothetical protein